MPALAPIEKAKGGSRPTHEPNLIYLNYLARSGKSLERDSCAISNSHDSNEYCCEGLTSFHRGSGFVPRLYKISDEKFEIIYECFQKNLPPPPLKNLSNAVNDDNNFDESKIKQDMVFGDCPPDGVACYQVGIILGGKRIFRTLTLKGIEPIKIALNKISFYSSFAPQTVEPNWFCLDDEMMGLVYLFRVLRAPEGGKAINSGNKPTNPLTPFVNLTPWKIK